MNMEQIKIPFEQIAMYLNGTASPFVKREVEKWLVESDEHLAIFHSLKNEWVFLKEEISMPLPNKEKVWSGIMQTTGRSAKVVNYSKQILIKYISLTACVALLFGIGFSFLFSSQGSKSFQFTANTPLGEKAMLMLPDSSKVWLNSGSKLTYTAQSKQRIVNLQGEAFFEVKKDHRKAFVVQAGEVNVQVHGTNFNISAYDSDPEIAVSLESGLVSLLERNSGVVLAKLKPNQMGCVSKEDFTCRILPDDPEITKLWTNNILKVYDSNFLDAAKKLERWFGVNITLENVNPDSRYTFVVKTESLKEILDLFNKMTPIAYKIEGKEVNIRMK